MTEVTAREIQWFAVRMKPNASGGPRTAIVDVEKEQYTNRAGRKAWRKVKGTGTRVFLPEHLLKRAGFEVFLPVKKVLRIKNRFTKEKHLVAVPLLADWMFVGWPADESRWHKLMGFGVVAGVMGTGGRPIQMSNKAVTRLMRQYGGRKFAAVARKRMQQKVKLLSVGDRARVVEGPFEGTDIRITEIGTGSVKGMLNILGGDVQVDIASDVLEVLK